MTKLPLLALHCVLVSLLWLQCSGSSEQGVTPVNQAPFVVVLGITQDAGFPQADCRKPCCAAVWHEPSASRHAACLGIVNPQTKQAWLIDATPDFKFQLHNLLAWGDSLELAGIFLTHGHIGHYTGLMHLGREAMNAKAVPVYAMPRMHEFLRTSGPWEQLVRLRNIELRPLNHDSSIVLNARLRIEPFLVPHRDEYTETVGFRIIGPSRSCLYLPDIDKWEEWSSVESALAEVDVAFIDGTFYDGGELPGRNMAEIPHPFIVESLARFQALPASEREKIRFIHFNHTNPVLQPGNAAVDAIRGSGLDVATEGQRLRL